MKQTNKRFENESTKVLVVGISSQQCYDFFCSRMKSLRVSPQLAKTFEEAVCLLQDNFFDVVWVHAPLFKTGERTWSDEIRDFHGGWLIWSGKRPDAGDDTHNVQTGVDVSLFLSDSPQINVASYIAIFRHIDMCRRAVKHGSTATPRCLSRIASSASGGSFYQNGKLSVGVTPTAVQFEGQPLQLDWREFELLRLLIRHQGRVIHRRFLQQWIFGEEGDDMERQLIHIIRLLRQKLGDNPTAPTWIVPVCESGYRMNVFN